MKIYKVGGAVRDQLLGLDVKDIDWVVVGATKDKMLDAGFTQKNSDFPVFNHPETDDEYALARREVKVATGYKGFVIDASIDVTLEEDLARRDLTINAMAMDEQGQIIDPWKGQDDIELRYLRHITPAFVEDPLRLLRIARFAARFDHLGFRIHHSTYQLMKSMSVADELLALKPERIWREIKLVFNTRSPWRFFEILNRCGALSILMPSLAECMTDDESHGNQSSSAIHLMRSAIKNNLAAEQVFALLFFHAYQEDELLCSSLKAEKNYCQALDQLTMAYRFWQQHAVIADSILQFMEKFSAFRHRHYWDQLLAMLALVYDGALVKQLTEIHDRLSSIDASVIVSQGYTGKAISEQLRQQRLQLITEYLS